MKKKFIKIIALVVCFVMAIAAFTGCGNLWTEADTVNHNLNVQAEYFECMRRITVYNARTDLIILEAEGYMNVSNNTHNELVITCKVGPNEYKKNYIYLNEYALYVVEDITGTNTNPYHYKLYFHTNPGFDVEVVP
jgi:hypothetical protein